MRWPLATAIALSIAGWALTLLAYYPGLFTYDTLDQFAQAKSGAFGDWHPPAMAAVWFALNKVWPGPAPLLILHASLFWGGVCAFSLRLVNRRVRWGAFAPLLGLLPFVFNYLGLLWKDVALMAAWTAAIGCTFAARGVERRGLRVALMTLAWTAFVYGALARANSLFAAAPLALYLLAPALRSWPQRLGVLAAAPAAVWLTAALLAGPILHAERQHPMSSLQVFDLAGIAHFSGAPTMPGLLSADENTRIAACYRPDKWDHLTEDPCGFVANHMDHDKTWTPAAISHAWTRAIVAHPIAYATHRLANFSALLGPEGGLGGNFMMSEMHEAAYMHHPNALFRAYQAVCGALAATPLFQPWFWLLIALVELALCLRAPAGEGRAVAATLAASGALYLLTYGLVCVGSDFRYAYWTIVATLLAGFVLFIPAAASRSAPAAR